MLGILWLILKIILIIIGTILALVLLVIGIFLFSSLKYDACGSKNEHRLIKAKFKWLFGIVKGGYEIDGEITKYFLYVPFGICNVNYISDENSINIDIEEKNICNNDEIINKSIANIEKNSKIYSIVENIKAFFNKIKNFIIVIVEKIKFAQNFNDKYSIRDLISVTWRLIIKLFKNLGLKKFEVNGVVGFDNPCDTGKILGAVSVIQSFLPLSVNVEGNFKEKELTGDFNIKGRTNLWLILFPLLKYILTRPVWPVVKDYWKGELNG